MLILVVGSGGCGKAGNTSSLSMSSYPHQNGYQWEYKTTLTIGASDISTYTIKQYFNGETTLSNGLVVQNLCSSYDATSSVGITAIKIIKSFASPSSTWLYYVSGAGVYSYGTTTYPTTEATCLFPLPLDVGDIWTIAGVTYEVIKEEDITVPAGNFRTLKVAASSSGTGQYDYKWYADGIGLVKSSFNFLTLSSTVEGGRIILSTIEVEGCFVEELVRKNF